LFDLNSRESYVLNVTGTSDSPVAWSPDSKWLIYISYRDGNPRLYMVDPNCHIQPSGCKYNEKQLLQSEYVRWPPTWSPDGKRLVFTGISHSDTELYMVDVDCTNAPSDCIRNEVRLTDNQADDFAPAWSPDGKTIAFLSERDGPTSIYLMDVQSGQTHRLNDEDFNSLSLAWSPDSREILLAATKTGQSTLYMVDAKTGVTRRLTGSNQSVVDPVWRP
jgi:TolB protein